MSRIYNDPINGDKSSVGEQLRMDVYKRKALIDLVKEQFFGQLSGHENMPKNMGKTIKKYHYLPMLDDRNINDQGLDASGAVIANGNLYGSSKDVGTITSKLPVLSENGGRVNRVGFKRIQLEGTIEKLGFFEEYTKESMDFDTDEQLEMHIHRELTRAANEMTEDAIQIDLLNAAGTIRYPGAATQRSEITAEGPNPSFVTYDDLMRLAIDLDKNRTPKHTTIITGSLMTNTRVVAASRYMFIGSELIPTVKKMVDSFGNPAFIPVQQYADAGTVANGEIGSIDQFRFIVVPEMQSWEGGGASVGTNPGYYEENGSYSVFPMLVVGEGAFSTIGFQTDGKNVKFKIKHVKPESDISYGAHDPYGEKGFTSIKWYYGNLIERAERIALIPTVAEM